MSYNRYEEPHTARELDQAEDTRKVAKSYLELHEEIERLTRERDAANEDAARLAEANEDRHTPDRCLIINKASTDLENIVNGHDPEIHHLGNRVWDRLDKMALDIEALAAHRARVGGE